MKHTALLLASALAAPPGYAQSASAGTVTIALNPPVDQDLTLTIRDQRSMPGGAVLVFTVVHHVRFSSADDGWRATITQQSADCSGPDAVCRAYTTAMTAASGVERQFGVGRDGTIALLRGQHGTAAGDTAADGAGSDAGNAGMVVAMAEGGSPGALIAGELREAIRYARQHFVLDAPPAHPSAHPSAHSVFGIGARAVDGGLVEITVRRRLEGAGQTDMIRRTIVRVDPRTGLSSAGVTETHLISSGALSDEHAPPISVRTWSLEAPEVPEGAGE
ncbi:MAG: hypothetical protein ABL882_09600 [Sphingopyxis sp.]